MSLLSLQCIFIILLWYFRSVSVPFIVLDDKKKDIEATEALDKINKEDLKERLGKNGLAGMELKRTIDFYTLLFRFFYQAYLSCD